MACKTKEPSLIATKDGPRNPRDYSYSLDSLDSLREYIPLLSARKLRGEHYCYTIISHVNVVDVKAGVLLPDRTVVLHDGVIEQILSSEERRVKINRRHYRVLEINAGGKYLAPGLCDMHTHYACENDMRLRFLINGVTTVRNAEGTRLHLDEQRLLSGSQLLGPNCYSNYGPDVNPLMKDTVIHWPMPANWLYVNNNLHPDSLLSVFTLAQRHMLRVSIDGRGQLPEIKYPDNTAFEQWSSIEMLQRQSNFSTFWFFSKFSVETTGNALYPAEQSALNALKNAPEQFCIGSESQPFISLQGSPVVNEMKFLTAHAVPRITALQIATYNAGVFVNAGVQPANGQLYPSWFGEVKEGYRADLVLLGRNPLNDVGNYARPQSVFVNGVYLGANDLREMTRAIVKLK